MTRFTLLRDGLRSRLPGSNARHLELDHLRPFDHQRPHAGGQSTPTGLVTAGQREHHLKTDRVLSVTGDANQELTITTHTGHTYMSWPETWDTDQPTYRDLGDTIPKPRSPFDDLPPF